MCGYAALAWLEAGAGADVHVPAGGPPPLGPFARLPRERLWDERQLDGCAVRRHRRLGSCHEVVGVDDDRRVSPASRTAVCSSCSASSPMLSMRMSGSARTYGRRDLLGAADEERVPGLGEEAPVGEDDLTDR